MTIYCYDTEFLEDGSTIDLISIGIVADDGREYYAVNSEMDYDRIKREPWLCENVIPHLPLAGNPPTVDRHSNPSSGYYWTLDMKSTVVKPKWVIANEVRQFLVGDIQDRDEAVPESEHPQLWAYYGAYDHVALCQLWGPMVNHPRFLPMYTRDLKQEMDRLGIESALVPQPENAHDALADAHWNMAMLAEILRRRELRNG